MGNVSRGFTHLNTWTPVGGTVRQRNLAGEVWRRLGKFRPSLHFQFTGISQLWVPATMLSPAENTLKLWKHTH